MKSYIYRSKFGKNSLAKEGVFFFFLGGEFSHCDKEKKKKKTQYQL
jgi:hypothetical protein